MLKRFFARQRNKVAPEAPPSQSDLSVSKPDVALRLKRMCVNYLNDYSLYRPNPLAGEGKRNFCFK